MIVKELVEQLLKLNQDSKLHISFEFYKKNFLELKVDSMFNVEDLVTQEGKEVLVSILELKKV